MSVAEQLGITQQHIGDDEKMWGALCQLIPLIGLLVIFALDDQKNKPFVRYHAVVSVAVALILLVVNLVTCAIAVPLTLLVPLFLAWKAYSGEVFDVPGVTKFLVDKGYLDSVKQLTSGKG
jgi:uncharacterized membrane protein